MDAMDKIFSDLASQSDALDSDTLIGEYRKIYEMGRTSMALEIELKQDLLKKFREKANTPHTRKAIEASLKIKFEEWHANGLLKSSEWEPKLRVEVDGNMVTITPEDEETARWWAGLEYSGT